MKLSRQQLKSIIKECLVEILAEGLTTTQFNLAEQRKSPVQEVQKRSQVPQPRKFNPVLDTPLKEAITNVAQGNKLMQSIFEDTAKTTLVKMQNAGDNGHSVTPTMNSVEHFEGDPTDIFGPEMTKNWEFLAFNK
jgi:light-regulated signal transduction histidine kinase (bacteriophytochrome)